MSSYPKGPGQTARTWSYAEKEDQMNKKLKVINTASIVVITTKVFAVVNTNVFWLYQNDQITILRHTLTTVVRIHTAAQKML